jgi:hypothetical protein
LVYAHLGRRADALSEIDKLERLGAEGYGVGYDIATIHAALGDTDAGCAALERALVDHSLLLPWMRLDPAWIRYVKNRASTPSRANCTATISRETNRSTDAAALHVVPLAQR